MITARIPSDAEAVEENVVGSVSIPAATYTFLTTRGRDFRGFARHDVRIFRIPLSIAREQCGMMCALSSASVCRILQGGQMCSPQ
jgi:hypothetical protein